MPFDIHQEKTCPNSAQSAHAAALKAVVKLGGKLEPVSGPLTVTAKFPKTVLGKVLGERTHLTCEIRADGEGSRIVIDAYPLDAVERKLMFGARKGVTATLASWFIAHLEDNLEPRLPPPAPPADAPATPAAGAG